EDIGIGKGKALIFRNIGALVLKHEAAGNDMHHALSIGAGIEFFLHHIPSRGGGKNIVISGHTDCGGLEAYWHGNCSPKDHYLPLYLENLKDVRERIRSKGKAEGWDDVRHLHALEEESVRQSMANLMTYPAVGEALQQHALEIHGWIINTATQRIS